MYVQNTGFLNSFIGHGYRDRQFSARGHGSFSHKAGERVCLVAYGAVDLDDGAVFFVDVNQILRSRDNPAE